MKLILIIILVLLWWSACNCLVVTSFSDQEKYLRKSKEGRNMIVVEN